MTDARKQQCREKSKRYRERHPGAIKAQWHRYYSLNKKRIQAQQRDWARRNPERLKVYEFRRRLENVRPVRAKQTLREKLQKKLIWQRNNKEKLAQQRKVRRKINSIDITPGFVGRRLKLRVIQLTPDLVQLYKIFISLKRHLSKKVYEQT